MAKADNRNPKPSASLSCLSADVSAKAMNHTLHVFSGTFGSSEKACCYSEPQWERPAPDDSWPEEEYAAWEARNPTWLLRKDLAVGSLDPDFVETIFGPHKLDYLRTQLANESDKRKVADQIAPDADTLVLILSRAFDGRAVRLTSTSALKYHGEFLWGVKT